MSFSHLYSSITESATLAITKKVRELVAQGKDVVGLTLGEPDFDTPEHIKQAAKKAIDDNITHYPPVAGFPQLRKAIADKLNRENGLSYTAQDVLVSTGAKQSVFNAMNALCNPGDEAIVPAPFWVSYREMLIIAGATVIEIECSIENAFKITPAQLEKAITPKTKLMIFSSPSNPTGSMYTREELEGLAAVLRKYPQIFVITDEIYELIAFEKSHVSFASLPGMFERSILINGMSKGFAMTGWRLGYMATANKELLYLCEKVQGQITSGANSIAQMAAIAALNGDMQPAREMTAAFKARRDRMFAQLSEIKNLKVILPDGAFYFYPDVSAFIGKTTPEGQTLSDVDALCLYLIDCGVAVIPGSAFGTQSHIRISYAYSPDVLDKGVSRLKEGLERLR